MAERAIAKGQSIRLGRQYKAGDEDALYEAISSEDAEVLVKNGILEGSWKGAKGNYARETEQRQQDRIARTPFGKALRLMGNQGLPSAPAGSTESQGTATETSSSGTETTGEDAGAKPYTMRSGAGGWYTFHDANDEPATDGEGKPIKAQGEAAAQKKLDELNS